MSQSHSGTIRPHTLREWSDNLRTKATPPLFSICTAFSSLAVVLSWLVGAIGFFYAAMLWSGNEALAALNELILAAGSIACAACALFCAASGTRMWRKILLIACVCTGLATATAGLVIHRYFVPEGLGWFGTFGKPSSMWTFAVAVMLISLLAAVTSNLVYLKRTD